MGPVVEMKFLSDSLKRSECKSLKTVSLGGEKEEPQDFVLQLLSTENTSSTKATWVPPKTQFFN